MVDKIKALLVAGIISIPTYAQTIYVRLTHYHPVHSECHNNPLLTADGSKINLAKLKHGKIKWCAISRELLPLFPKGKQKKVWIEGHGVYEVRDVTNKRIKNTIDILLHPSSDKKIFKKRVKVKILQS